LKWLSIIAVVLFVFVCYFFRDPQRTIPSGENRIVSPADGTVVGIKTVRDDTYLKTEVTQVSIFLSVFNVHINRIPISGKISYFKYFSGKFLAAWNEKASIENEQTHLVIENGKIKLVMKQIAGLIARRIICRVAQGDQVTRGDRFGMIKFGSRVDLLLPKNVAIRVKLKDTVTGGESIIGEIQ
jgi:phosphatidylserine decarboxylase